MDKLGLAASVALVVGAVFSLWAGIDALAGNQQLLGLYWLGLSVTLALWVSRLFVHDKEAG